MVRRHQNDGLAITEVTETFGVSRPTFYKAQGALAAQGLAGLVPRQRGPKGGHKISAEVLSFVEEVKAATPNLTSPQVIDMIAERFGRGVHRRSLERTLARKKIVHPCVAAAGEEVINAYERLRAAVLGAEPIPSFGLATMRREGMAAWVKAAHQTPVLPPAVPLCRRPLPTPRGRSPLSYSPVLSSRSTRRPPVSDIKITADHLRREAYLYVRQSTLRQVAENGESMQRQYALRDRATACGWPAERIHVIDCDLGKSGSSAVARDGFGRAAFGAYLQVRHAPGGRHPHEIGAQDWSALKPTPLE